MSPLFDEAAFAAFKAELGDEDASEALAIFLADAAEGMAQLAGCGEDRARIRREAHALKSSAATLGFAELARLARELEPQAATLEPARLRQAVAALARCFAATRERLGAPP